MHRWLALSTAVLVATSTAVSACSPSEAAERAPAPVSETVAAPEKVTRDAAAPATPQWQNVNGTAMPRVAPDGVQYGAQPYPGNNFGQRQANGEPNKCTLGPLVRRISDGAHGFITAGHCDENPGEDVYIWSGPDGGAVLAGMLTGKRDNNADQDSALLETVLAPAHDATKIAGKFPISGVMSVAEVKALEPGTPICLDGARSGVMCGPLVRTDWDTIKFGTSGKGGDSGSTVFLVGADNRAVLIGIFQGEDGVTAMDEATYLQPALDRLGVEIVTS